MSKTKLATHWTIESGKFDEWLAFWESMKAERSKFIVNEYIMKIDDHNVVGFAEFVDANAMDQVIEHIRRDDINDNDERLGVKVSIFQEIEL